MISKTNWHKENNYKTIWQRYSWHYGSMPKRNYNMTRTIVRFYVTDVIRQKWQMARKFKLKKDILINRRRVKGESPHWYLKGHKIKVAQYDTMTLTSFYFNYITDILTCTMTQFQIAQRYNEHTIYPFFSSVTKFVKSSCNIFNLQQSFFAI